MQIHQDLSNHYATGWIDAPLQDNDELLASINYVANEIKACADVLVVIGVGGVYCKIKVQTSVKNLYRILHYFFHKKDLPTTIKNS
ncbi:hypothetical protein ACIQVU_18130 [Lysinibacillus sp. NPDC098008]|uniref:hypothetical protein n=1 Tax=Lysinibacillus sp. NPDC098008 TaxID=3364146 RepID=UPI003811F5E1